MYSEDVLKKPLKFALTGLFAAVLGMGSAGLAMADDDDDDDEVEITLIHIGDIHGHMIPRPNLRSDVKDGKPEGGLARMYTKIKQIREDNKGRTLLLNTGDTIQGSAEALYTRGQALVTVLNKFGIDGYAPGNWEFVYGTARFKEIFAGDGVNPPLAPWSTVSANVRNVEADKTCAQSSYVLPPYVIKEVKGVKIGLLGFTTDRGPQVVGSAVTSGLCFLSSVPGSSGTPDVSEVEAELQAQIAQLRNVEKVDIVVMLSELGLANNSLLAQRNDGIDVVLSSDMHEETKRPVVVYTPTGGKTILVEEGQDGTNLGELELEIKNGKIVEWEWKSHVINSSISEDYEIAKLVAEVRKPFVSSTFQAGQVNPFNDAILRMPIDTVVGNTEVGLHRSNFSNEEMPGTIEGTSHDFLTDAFRVVSGADIGAIRGFRYGTHVKPGKIKLEDLYHYMPIGPRIAKGTIVGQAMKNQIENAANGSLNPDPRRWTGGWLFNFSNVTMDIDPTVALTTPAPYPLNVGRASNIKVGGQPLALKNTDGSNKTYTYASYWYTTDQGLINRVPASNIQVAVRDPNTGKAKFVPVADINNYEQMDGTEVVVQYLQDNLFGTLRTVDLPINRNNLVKPLPLPVFGNPEVQPLRGAQ